MRSQGEVCDSVIIVGNRTVVCEGSQDGVVLTGQGIRGGWRWVEEGGGGSRWVEEGGGGCRLEVGG